MSEQKQSLMNLLETGATYYLSHISLDCVVFGFHENQLKVLLLKMKDRDKWGLPGGFVRKEESVELAANRVLKERTGLDNIFLQQFHVFSDPDRSNNKDLIESARKTGIEVTEDNWFAQRFISIGFYALVEFSQVKPTADAISDDCTWWDLQEIKSLMLDHNLILNKALETLRLHLNYQPIGYTLLPDKFTMPELQKLYETILGKKLDRRNFQRKITGYGILKRWEERRSGVAHKAPYFYSFDTEKYKQALQEGLDGGW
ncbi:NUDIX hydrolase [Xanthocytophaga agilis]|uniref:NUDIX domain-containing protein n=1 Tax=Xanthocytophaga agilis TaxID=3048010 RepID=A0AAE3UDN3_9BACT|nr:NUDIX domain-containing protein [Xanthocytophaga agilis]MDJ1501405.1 NUDIX domain-containing protein [Xanthocytophaga agilis]